MATLNGTKVCSIEGCDAGIHCKSLCNAHYRRLLNNGDPHITKRPGLGKSLAERLEMHTERSESGCWMWTAGGVRYGKLQDGEKSVSAHVAAYELSNGPVPMGQVVRHKCDVPKCVNPAHLEVGTHADNSRDMTSQNRQAWGEKQGGVKLTAHQVLAIRETYATLRVTQRELALEYGVSQGNIRKIVTGNSWRLLQQEAG